MKLPPEADPNFWVGATCVAVRVSHFISGAVLRRFVLASAAGAKTRITDETRQYGAPFSAQNYALALARAQRKRGATDAMRRILPHIARVDLQIAALLPAAEQRGMDAFRRRKALDDERTNVRRRNVLLDEIRENADVVSEEEVVTAWREGVVDGVHNL